MHVFQDAIVTRFEYHELSIVKEREIVTELVSVGISEEQLTGTRALGRAFSKLYRGRVVRYGADRQ